MRRSIADGMLVCAAERGSGGAGSAAIFRASNETTWTDAHIDADWICAALRALVSEGMLAQRRRRLCTQQHLGGRAHSRRRRRVVLETSGSAERRAAYGETPGLAQRLEPKLVFRRLVPLAAASQQLDDVGRLTPDADGEPGERCGPERRRLDIRRDLDGAPSRSACSCMRNPFAAAPPSARSSATPPGTASTTSRDLERDRLERRPDEVRPCRPAREAADRALARPGPSTGSRARSARVRRRLRRSSRPTARAPRTRRRSPIRPSPSRSHCSAAPATSTAPSSA